MPDNNIDMQTHASMLTSLDSLFDTRLGTIYKLNKELYLKYLKSKEYMGRLQDRFVGIEQGRFDFLYDNRDMITLRHSPPTKVRDFIKAFVIDVREDSIQSPFKMVPKIYINIYPYVLRDEVIDMFVQGLSYYTAELADIEVINKPIEELTPTYLKDIGCFFYFEYMYDIWINNHIDPEKTKKKYCPHICMYSPMVFTNKDPDIDAKKALEGLQYLEKAMKPFIDLNFLPIGFFSSIYNMLSIDSMDAKEILLKKLAQQKNKDK